MQMRGRDPQIAKNDHCGAPHSGPPDAEGCNSPSPLPRDPPRLSAAANAQTRRAKEPGRCEQAPVRLPIASPHAPRLDVRACDRSQSSTRPCVKLQLFQSTSRPVSKSPSHRFPGFSKRLLTSKNSHVRTTSTCRELRPIFCLPPRHIDRLQRFNRESLECCQRRFPADAVAVQPALAALRVGTRLPGKTSSAPFARGIPRRDPQHLAW
jgi:hypothetical protein